jgi:hypothetical protein
MMDYLLSHEIHHENGTTITITDVPSNLSPLASFLKMQVICEEISSMKQPKSIYSFDEFWRKDLYFMSCGISYFQHKENLRDCKKGFT